jgi:hypothetical protein
MPDEFLSDKERLALHRLGDDLIRVFGPRLRTLVAYEPATSVTPRGRAVHTLALVDALSFDDLSNTLTVVPAWHKSGLATPLILSRDEFERTLDVFPIEHGAILARHVVIRGAWPQPTAAVAESDLRRACERQIKGHLIHLREGFLETHGRPSSVTQMLRASVPAFRSALRNIARLYGASSMADDAALVTFATERLGVDGSTVRDVLAFDQSGQATDAPALLPRYIQMLERLWEHVDGWHN